MDYKAAKRWYELADSLWKKSLQMSDAANIIMDHLNKHEEGIEIEVTDWICPGCGWVYARSIVGPLGVPQPENGVLTCASRCGAKWKTEDGLAQVEWFQKVEEDETAVRPQPTPVEGEIMGRCEPRIDG